MIPQSTTLDPRSDPGYSALKDYVIRSTGLAYYANKDEDLASRLEKRLQQTDCPDCASYLETLTNGPQGDAELDRLVEELTVGETSFFRHEEVFASLRDRILPDLIARNGASRRLKIWSAGCSTGAESYSLSIMLRREFAREIAGWDVSIVGTDINRHFLARAQTGSYRVWDFRGVDVARIESCFTRRGDEFLILPEFRQGVSFQYHNLVRHPFPSLINNLIAFDLILCRNVLIYFDAEVSAKVIAQHRDCLVNGGWLIVGAAEPSVSMFREFETINVSGAVLYRRRDADAKPIVEPQPIVFGCSPSQPLRAPDCGVPVSPPRTPAQSATTARERPPALALETIQCAADRGNLSQALRDCERAIANDRMNAESHLLLAMIADQLGDHRRAESALRDSLYLNPSNVLAHYFTGSLRQRQSRNAEATVSYRNVIRFTNGRPDAEPVHGTKSMTIGELRELARMQLELLGSH